MMPDVLVLLMVFNYTLRVVNYGLKRTFIVQVQSKYFAAQATDFILAPVSNTSPKPCCSFSF